MVKSALKKEEFRKRLSTENLQYYVQYDYNSYNSCEESGCHDEGICRCGVIEDAHVEPIDIPSFVNKIYELYNPTDKTSIRDKKLKSVLFDSATEEIDLYCIDRICRSLKVWNTDNWEVNVCGGYYGQEIDGVTFNSVNALEDKIETVLALNTLKEKIDFVLTVEYGHVLPDLVKKDYELITISKEDVIFGSDGQYRKVSDENLEHYSDKEYKGIRGLVIPKGKKYRLIDGYHRIFATNSDKIKVLSTIDKKAK